MVKRLRRICTLAAVVAGVWVGPAGAQSVYTGVRPPDAGSVDTGGSAARSSSAGLQAVQSTQRGGLAFTGADITGLVAIGGGAIALGTILKRRAEA